MADFQRVVEFLRDLRQGSLQSVTDEIMQVATDYAALCNQANDRLRQCSSFLQQGLRSEAIHLAEEAPNLLDLVAALDLPDPQQWIEFCQNNGLAVPPPLQLDRAAQLNDAYAQDQPLEHLMAQHRLLALARAPVRMRLDVLRKIAQVDTVAGTWEKDIRLFEKARLKELPTAFYQAVKTRDEKNLVGLMDEVNRQSWFEPVPEDLATAVSDAFTRMQRAGVESELRKLIVPLRDAFAARSLQECQALAQRWKHAMSSAGVSAVSTELHDEIKPVLAFISEQTKRDEYLKRFKEACRGFGKLLDQDVPDAQLEAGWARVKEFREEVPDELTRRYLAKKAGRRKAADRSHRVRLMTIGAVALVVLAIGFFVAVMVTESMASQGYADKIKAALSLHSKAGLDQAQAIVADLNHNKPGLLKQANVAAQVSDLEASQAQYEHDLTSLESWLKDAGEARKNAAALLANNAAAIGDIARAQSVIQDRLRESNAGNPMEWADADQRLAPMHQGLQSDSDDLSNRIASQLATELSSISTQVDAIGGNSTDPDVITDARVKLGALSDHLAVLSNLPGLDDKGRGAIKSQGIKIQQHFDALGKNLGVADELQIIRSNATSADKLRQSLQAFVNKFPGDPHTQDFKKAIPTIAAAAGIEAWHDRVASFNGTFAPDSAAVAQKRLDDLAAYQSAFPDSPINSLISQYLDYLHLANDALSDSGTWKNAFSQMLANTKLTQLTFFELADGRRYFLPPDPKRTESRINDQVVVSFQAYRVNGKNDLEIFTVHTEQAVSQDPVPAPHVKVVQEIADRVKLINEKNWDNYGIDLADQLARNNQIDPVVKAMLIEQTAKTEDTVAGWAVGDAYAKLAQSLSRLDLDTLPFIDPTKVSDSTKKTLADLIATLPNADQMRKKLDDAKARLFHSIEFKVQGVGVILKDDSGLAVYSHATVASGSILWTVVPGPPAPALPDAPPAAATSAPASQASAAPPIPAANPFRLIQIGQVKDNKFVLDEVAARDLPQGSIVYITNP